MNISDLPKTPSKQQMHDFFNLLPYEDVKRTMNEVIIEFRKLDPELPCRKKIIRERERNEILKRLDVVVEA